MAITLPGTGQTVASRQVGGEHFQSMLSEDPLITRIDEASASVTYIGKAVPGTAVTDAGWQIRKMTTGSETVVAYADGNVNFDNVWNNRAGLTYS